MPREKLFSVKHIKKLIEITVCRIASVMVNTGSSKEQNISFYMKCYIRSKIFFFLELHGTQNPLLFLKTIFNL